MSSILVALSTSLHVLATIVMIGYFIFAGQIYLPVFECQMRANQLRNSLEQVSARLRPFFGGSLLIFLVTGAHLMLINESYPGLGNFFANPWTVLILVKHVLVVAFVALAMLSERAFVPQIGEQNPGALKRFREALNFNAALGVVVILLTSFAQAG